MLTLIVVVALVGICSASVSLKNSPTCRDVILGSDYNASTPLILCCLLPEQFYTCDSPQLNASAASVGDVGYCEKFGGVNYEDVNTTAVYCTVVDGIDCYGNKTFTKYNVPCVRYDGYYFPSIVLYSLFLGILGVDRFCLGYTCLGAAKLLTLGGIGVWWVVDLILLIAGLTNPNNGYSWDQYF